MIKCRKILWLSLGVIIFSITSSAYASGTWIQINNKSGGDLYWSNSGDEDDCARNKKALTKGRIRVDGQEDDYINIDWTGVSATIYICQEENSNGDINFMVLNLRYIAKALKTSCDWDQELWGLYLTNDDIELKVFLENSTKRTGCVFSGDMYEGTLFINGEEVHTR